MEVEDEVQQVVIHELIHAYDDCRGANMDWNDCAHQACSEVSNLKPNLSTASASSLDIT